MVRRELDEWFDSLAPEVPSVADPARTPTRPAGSSSRTRTAASLVRRGRASLSRGRVRGGPAAGPRHAGRRVREGLSPRRRRDPLARLRPARPAASLVRRMARAARGSCDPGAGPHARTLALGVQRARARRRRSRRAPRDRSDRRALRRLPSRSRHHALRAVGATLGSRADRLPARCSARLARSSGGRASSRSRSGPDERGIQAARGAFGRGRSSTTSRGAAISRSSTTAGASSSRAWSPRRSVW